MRALNVITIGVAVAAAVFGIVSGVLILRDRPLPFGRWRSRLDGWAQVLMGVFCAAVAAGAVLNRSEAAVLVLMPIGLAALAVALGLQVKSIRRQ